jgi:hypothetical protein
MVITINNAVSYLMTSGIHKKRMYGSNNINQYMLLVCVEIALSNGKVIKIPNGYVWDLASVPRLLWGICPPDSDAELAFLIHDYLYENRIGTRKWADKEMLKWSIATNGTNNWSIRNIDNYIRYWAVRLGGRKAWNTN